MPMYRTPPPNSQKLKGFIGFSLGAATEEIVTHIQHMPTSKQHYWTKD
jgi:hypothetical protein